tara:strand:+ start:520 stop:726 length:207 start_codon:yes stop_codon:yes gene_type:complete
MNQFLAWFAKSPLAAFSRVLAAGVLGWVLMNANDLNIHPAVAISLASSLPILIAWLNPADTRYGKNGE